MVVDRYVELGQLVVPGHPVARVIDPYVLKLEAYLTGIGLMLAFIIGLVLANTVVVAIAASGFSGINGRRRTATAVGLLAGFASIAVGVIFTVGFDTGLPDLAGLLGASGLD